MTLQGFEDDCRWNLDFSKNNCQYKHNQYKTIHHGYTSCPKCKPLLKDIKRYKQSCHKAKAQNCCKEYGCDVCGVVKTTTVGLKDHMQSVKNPETKMKCKFTDLA